MLGEEFVWFLLRRWHGASDIGNNLESPLSLLRYIIRPLVDVTILAIDDESNSGRNFQRGTGDISRIIFHIETGLIAPVKISALLIVAVLRVLEDRVPFRIQPGGVLSSARADSFLRKSDEWTADGVRKVFPELAGLKRFAFHPVVRMKTISETGLLVSEKISAALGLAVLRVHDDRMLIRIQPGGVWASVRAATFYCWSTAQGARSRWSKGSAPAAHSLITVFSPFECAA